VKRYLLVVLLLAACAPGSKDTGTDPTAPDLAFNTDPAVAVSGETASVVQILHASDQEAGIAAIEDAPRFSAVLNGLRDDYPTTLTLMSGDLYIPGPFFSTTTGQADIRIMDALGTQASVFGNHEFDLGTNVVGGLIAAEEPDEGEEATDDLYPGTTFPYLSSNLDFSESDLADFVVADAQEASTIPNSIAKSAVITAEGETYGVVGVTTPLLPSISSPGGVVVSPSNPEDMEALAAIAQPVIDDLSAQGINKIVVLAHMQQLDYELTLATLLRDVDIIIAGGSDTLLADDNDRLRVGDVRAGMYPLLRASASGEPVAVVNTSREYRYVGRLVAGFDGAGVLSEIREESGAYATDAEGVTATGGAAPAPEVVAATDEVREVVTELDGEIFGSTEVYLNGQREFVRTEETNLGNLSADANLAAARAVDPTVAVSIKNGGGIRASIGAVQPGPEGTLIPPVANPLTGKEAGQVSLLDVQNALRFDNGLSVLTLTAAQLKAILEHGVAATGPGSTPGQFPQVGGVRFSFDPSAAASEYSEEGDLVTEGERVQNAAIVNDDESVADVLVENGQLVGDPERLIRVVTLGFLADGGDSYPFPEDAQREELEPAEQAALEAYLGEIGIFSGADTPATEDARIQNLSVRDDTVLSTAAK